MAAEFSALCTWWDNYPKDAIANWLSEGAIIISYKCHVLSAMYRGWNCVVGGKKREYLWHAYPLPCLFSAGGLSGVVSLELSEGWGLASDSVPCTPSPLILQWGGKEGWPGPTVHSPANLCGRSRSGRAFKGFKVRAHLHNHCKGVHYVIKARHVGVVFRRSRQSYWS